MTRTRPAPSPYVNTAMPRSVHAARASLGATTPSSRARLSASIRPRSAVAASSRPTRWNAGDPALR